MAPVAWARQRPIGDFNGGGFFGVCTGPPPIFGGTAEKGGDRISFDVVGDFEEGFIFANGVGSEAALVDGAATSTFGSFSPANGVRSFEPVESLAEEIRALGLDEQVPVIWH